MSFGGPISASPLATPSGAGEDVPPLNGAAYTTSPSSAPNAPLNPSTSPGHLDPSAAHHTAPSAYDTSVSSATAPDEDYLAPLPPHIKHAGPIPHHPGRSQSTPMGMHMRPLRENSGPIQLPRRRRTHPVSRGSENQNETAVQRVMTDLFTPEHKVGPEPSFFQSVKAFFLSSWINVLLVFIPVGWALHFVKEGGNKSISDTAVFCVNFIAIIPLAGLLGFSTEELSLRVGQTLGGLINATLGNAVELIVAIIALIKCEIAVTQSSLIGSILSNLLLVLGMCFFAGGVKFSEQTVKGTVGQLNASLLLVSVIAVLIPSAFHFSINASNTQNGDARLTQEVEQKDILSMSHGVAVILLVIYCSSLVFQMWTHASLYKDEEVSQSTPYGPEMAAVPTRVRNKARRVRRRIRVPGRKAADVEADGTKLEQTPTMTTAGTATDAATLERTTSSHSSASSDDDEEVPQMNLITTLVMMVVTAVIVGVTAEFMVSSINGLVESNPALSAEFVGLILLPIVSNAAEHFTAVSVSVKDKIDLSIAVAVGSSIQVAMFVIPVVQLLAWCISKPMTMLFDPFEAVVLFFSVLIVNQTLADGRSNWMEGVVLMLLYLLIAIAFWYYVPVAQFITCR